MSNLTDIQNPFELKGMKHIISELKNRFFTLEEFPFIQRDVLPRNAAARAMNLSGEEIRRLAAGLKGKELEGLLLDIRDAEDGDIIRRGSEILQIRLSVRLMKLLTILYQYNYTSVGLNFTLKKLSQSIGEGMASFREDTFIRRFGAEENKLASVCTAIDEYEMEIDKCFQTFSIFSASPFAREAVLHYLGDASKEALMINRSWIIEAIEEHKPDQTHRLIQNYLSAFPLIELHDGINLSILNKIGQPYISPDWESYDVKLRDKFAQWCYLHQLKLHSMSYPRKFSILSKYYEQVRNSWQMKEESLMVIDFGEIVVADIATQPYSFFFEKETFEQEMQAWRATGRVSTGDIQETSEPYLPTFLRLDEKNRTARDFIIEEIEEPCVKLSYEGVDVLYIQEMMDIKMGLEPDMRRKQLAKLRRKSTGR